MPKLIDVPGFGKTEFPDEMSDVQIAEAIRENRLRMGREMEAGRQARKKSVFEGERPSFAAETISNIPGSAVRFGKDIASLATTDPVEVGLGLGRTVVGGVEKLIPGEQKDEQVFDAVTGFFRERYGGVDNLLNTIKTDPVGFAADVGAVLTGVGAGVKAAGTAAQIGKIAKTGQAISTAGRLVDPIGGIATGVGKVATTRKSVNTLVKTALALPKKKGLERIDELANAFVSKGMNVNRRTLRKLDKGMKRVRVEINNIIDTKTAEGIKIKTTAITDALDELIENAGREGLEKGDLKQIALMRQRFADVHGEILTPRQVQDIKVGFNKAFKADLNERFGLVKQKARNKMRDAAKSYLEELHPELQSLNADEGVMIELRKAIENRIIAVEKKPIIPVRGLVAGGIAGSAFGAGTGSVGAGIKFGVAAVLVDKIATDPRVQVAVAKAIHKINLVLAKSGKLPTLTRPAFQTGRVQELIDSSQ